MRGAYAKTAGAGIVKLFVFIASMNRKIAYAIPYDKALIRKARTIPNAKWNRARKVWEAPETKAAWLALEAAQLLDRVVRLDEIDESGARAAQSEGGTRDSVASARAARAASATERELTSLREVLLREGAAYATVKAYVGIVRHLQRWWGRPLAQATRADLLAYQTHCIEEKRYGRATMNQVVNGLRAYFERVLERDPDELRLPRPKRKRSLPNVCGEEQVRRMLREIENRKHQMMLALVYGLGLRRGELQRLLVHDVDLARGTVHVRQSKGNKDRVLGLPTSLRGLLGDYLARYTPEHWLFEGQSGGQYSATSIQKVFTRAKERSGLPPQLTLHGLRHSYATHLVEHGTSLHVLQDLLGHGSIETTRVYLHTSRKQLRDLYDPLQAL